MGQYHRVVNLDKKQYLDPHSMGLGAKLMEFGSSRLTESLVALLACSNGRGGGDYSYDGLGDQIFGMWAGDRIAVVGDYWGDNDDDTSVIPTWDMMSPEEGESEYKNISMDVMTVMCVADSWFRSNLLEDVARYDFGRDWSEIFTEEEIKAEQERQQKEREQNGV
jgi:hypothetical protein